MKFSTQQFVRLTGIPQGSHKAFREATGVRPDFGQLRGLCAHRPFGIGNVLGGSIWRGLRKMGVRHEDAAACCRLLWKMSQEELEHHFSVGQQFILVIKDLACPRLLTLDAIQRPQGVPVEIAANLSPNAVDVKKLFDGIMLEAEKDQPEMVSAGDNR